MRVKTCSRVCAVVFAVVALSFSGVQPAAAQTVGKVTFVGSLTVTCVASPGLADFVTVLPLKKTTGQNCVWTLTTIVCHNLIFNVNKPGKPPFVGGLCSLTAAGDLTGWCDLANGAGSGTLTDTTGNTYFLSKLGFKLIVDTMLMHSAVIKPGSNQKGVMDAEATTIDDPDCIVKAGTTFPIAGTMDFYMSGQTPLP